MDGLGKLFELAEIEIEPALRVPFGDGSTVLLAVPVIEGFVTGDEWQWAIPRNRLIERLLVQNFISCPAPVFQRSAWSVVDGLDETLWYTADWDLYLKLASAGPVVYHAEALTAFRLHGSSLTVSGSRDASDFEQQMRIVLDRHSGALAAEDSERTLGLARTSIAVNTSLAIAAAGRPAALLTVLRHMLTLWPKQLFDYWQWSRFGDRVIPRLRLRLAGRI